MSEAELIPGAEEEFLARLFALVASFPARYSGLLRHEVLVDQSDSCRVQYLSTWVDEDALIEYAGDDWRSQAVTFPDEAKFLRKPLSLRHYSSLTIEAAHDGTLA